MNAEQTTIYAYAGHRAEGGAGLTAAITIDSSPLGDEEIDELAEQMRRALRSHRQLEELGGAITAAREKRSAP